MNIYQKLIEVRKAVSYLKKENTGSQYSYVGSSQVLGAIRKSLDEQNLLLVPRVTDKNVMTETVENKDSYNGKEKIKRTTTYFTELIMEFTWVNADNPDEIIVCPWYGQGVDIAGEKGVGKALTYAEKYFMLKFFNIATDKDDPDAFQSKIDNDVAETPSRAKKPAPAKPEASKKKQMIDLLMKNAKAPTADDAQVLLKELTGKSSTSELTDEEMDKVIEKLGGDK